MHDPHLTALVVYLRPSRRAPLLAALANLGIFVTERQGLGPETGAVADIGIVCASDDADETRDVLAGLGERCRSIVCLQTAGASVQDCGPLVYSTLEDTFLADPAAALADASRRARNLRNDAPAAMIDGLVFESRTHRVGLSGETVSLTTAESGLLMELLNSPGTPVRSERLASMLSGAAGQRERYLRLLIFRLRKKLERLGLDPRMLATVRGVGYVLDRSAVGGQGALGSPGTTST